MNADETADSVMIAALREVYAIQDRLASGEISAAEGLCIFLAMDGYDRFGALELVAEAYGSGDVIHGDGHGNYVYAHSGVPVERVEALMQGLHIEDGEELPARAA